MLTSYIKLAFRNLLKHRLYAFINIAGLALGMTIFLFSNIIISYEYDHDNMFSKRKNIYTVGSIFAPDTGVPINEYPNARLAYGPLLNSALKETQLVVRSIFRSRVVTVNQSQNHYQGIRFTDPGFTTIFDFQYIHGDKSSLDDPHALIITVSTAKRLFGRIDVLGETITLEHKLPMFIGGVIKDVNADSHFNSSLLPDTELEAIASIEALIELGDIKMAGEWKSLIPSDLTYLLTPENKGLNALQSQVNEVYELHTTEDERKYISGLKVRPLIEANTQVWRSIGFPVLQTISLLGWLVLITACINYTNLATAQNFGRTQEVGLRKTFGAERPQLLLQFLIESLTISIFAMLLALSIVELLTPLYANLTAKAVLINYTEVLPGLIITTLLVGLLAGAYPAYLISRNSPLDSLRRRSLTGQKGSLIRGLMISVQFSISIFILAMVMIIYFQNLKMRDLSNVFPKSQVLILDRVHIADIKQNHQKLKEELNQVTGVNAVSFSNDIPFNSSTNSTKVTPIKNNNIPSININMVSVDQNFMTTYDIKLISGRSFDLDNSNDVFKEEVEQLNIIVNQVAAEKLGFGRGEDAVGQSFYNVIDSIDSQAHHYTIIGLMPDQYFNGVHTKIWPMAFFINPDDYSFVSLRLTDLDSPKILTDIDAAWARVIKNYPIRRSQLDFYFNLFFRIPNMISSVITIFAGVALSLALFGLFGLAAFMAQRRTKEIGIRKVMGASVTQIVGMLIWQFSKPVSWSLIIAMPLAFAASSIYLDFFPEQISFVIPVILFASVIGLLSAWTIVAIHAIKIARATPIKSLRYE